MSAEFALAADANNGKGTGTLRRVDPQSRIRSFNSRNHASVGQNVLYADGHVSWNETSFCGAQGDNIYLMGVGDLQSPGDWPQARNDAVLLPRGPQWVVP